MIIDEHNTPKSHKHLQGVDSINQRNTLADLMLKAPKLVPKQKEKWIKELRSGKHQQCKDAICQDLYTNSDGEEIVGYCCLGVYAYFCDTEPRTSVGILMHQALDDLFVGGFAAKKIQDGSDAQTLFTYMNDACDFTFEQIADVIEELC